MGGAAALEGGVVMVGRGGAAPVLASWGLGGGVVMAIAITPAPESCQPPTNGDTANAL